MSKLDGIKAGDRVRLTFEGVVIELEDYGFAFSPDNRGQSWIVPEREILADTFQITRLYRPLKVGDEVRPVDGGRHMEVVAILKDGRVVAEYQAGDTSNVMARDPSCFVHA